MNQWDLIMYNHCWMWFKADVIIQWNVSLTATCLMCLPILGFCAAAWNNCSTESRRKMGKEKVILALCILTESPKNYRYFIIGGGSHMITPGSFVSFSPSSFLCLRGDHSYTSRNYILGAVMHKQHPQLKESQIIWCPAPQELAAVDMTARIVTPCCTTATGGFRVLIAVESNFNNFLPNSLPTGPAFLYVYKLSPLSSRFICPAAVREVNKLALEISSDSKLSLRRIAARHLLIADLLYHTGCRIQNSKVQAQ